VHVAAREHLGDRMPHELADAQLPLRAAGPVVAMNLLVP
jgi:hypothetical protein